MNDIERLLQSLRQDPGASPSATFRTNARIRILNSVTQPLRPGWYKKPRLLGYTLGTALATVILSVGTVYAAQSSLPGSQLYGVKVASERVALTLSPTESLKSTVASTIISRRIDEMEHAQKSGDTEELNRSIFNYNQTLHSLRAHTDVSRERIDKTVAEHDAFLNSLNTGDSEEHQDSQGGQQTQSGNPQKESRSINENSGISPAETPPVQSVTPRTDIKLPDSEEDSVIRHTD